MSESNQDTKNKAKTGEEKEKLLNHSYDGIQELDNPLPRWWLATFYLAIIFSFIYVIFYHVADGPSLQKEFQSEETELKAQMLLSQKQEGPSEESLKKALTDSAALAKGKVVFDGKCASCHGPQGQGLVGPNLADKEWIHGKPTLLNIYAVIKNGVADKGMPPWGPLLSAEELLTVTAFVKSLKGTNPPNVKAPQGTAYEE